jgi:hypothetical protein
MLSEYTRRAASILGAAGLSLTLVGCSCYPEPPLPPGSVIVPPPQIPPQDDTPPGAWRRY